MTTKRETREGTAVAQLDSDALFTQYLNVVNRAMGEHRDTFPFKQILGASEKVLGDKPLAVAVYKEDPQQPHDWFTIALRGGTFDIVEHGKGDDAIECSVKRSHLERVVANQDEYEDNPVKLDLDWLTSRLGLS